MESDNKALVSIDMGNLIAACAAAGCAGTVSISIFPKDEPPEAEPARYATLGGDANGASAAEGEEGQEEGSRKFDAPAEESYESWLIRQLENVRMLHALMTEPPSINDRSVTEFGYKPLGELRCCIGEHLRATMTAIEEKLKAVQAG